MILLFQCRLHGLYFCTLCCKCFSVLHLGCPDFRLDALLPDPSIQDAYVYDRFELARLKGFAARERSDSCCYHHGEALWR